VSKRQFLLDVFVEKHKNLITAVLFGCIHQPFLYSNVINPQCACDLEGCCIVMVKTDLKNMMILSLFSEPLFESQCLGHTCLAFIIGKVLPQFKDLSSSHVVGPLLSGEALQLYSFVTFQR